MTPERFRQVRKSFESIIDLPPPQRDDAVRELRNADPELFADVQPILAAHPRNNNFLARPMLDLHGAQQRESELAGTRIGLYEIVREVGRGGMGTVYEAARMDGSFRKRVAIKIVNASFLSMQLQERFRQEREILAALEHPGIARILDAGTTEEGRPYFVMEYVAGVRIDRYCRDHRLSIDARLDLFNHVCDAVQFAHDHLIVHRDLKPTNILVTPEGAVKLLDFGIAKILGSPVEFQAAITSPSALFLTPEYSSPEQVLGKPVTVGADIYVLGLLLYELLTGAHPLHVPAGATPCHSMKSSNRYANRSPNGRSSRVNYRTSC